MTRSLDTLPGPRGLPLVGHLKALVDGPLEFLTEGSRAHGDLWRFRVGRQESVVATHPATIEQILVKHRNQTVKDPITAGLSDVLGQGLLTAEGETWRRNRRLIAPSFQPRHLADLGDQMVDSTADLVDRVPDGPRAIHDDMMALTLDIAVRTLFGAELDEGDRVGPLVDELMHGFDQKTHTWRRLLPDWLPTANQRIAQRNQRELHGILQRLVDRKRASDGLGSDLLSRLLAARDEDGHGMDDDQLRDELLTLFLAGHETTALALSYSLWLLARHPELQRRAHDELAEVVGDRRPTAMDSRRLPFLDAVFQESMRLYPPAWLVGRAASEDLVLDDVALPAGTVLLCPQWVVHRDARWFADPLRFDPDRWLAGIERPKFAFFPFGGGARTCVGNHFARMEAVLVLATWLQSLDVAPTQTGELDLMPSVTLRPKGGVHLRIRRRDDRRVAA